MAEELKPCPFCGGESNAIMMRMPLYGEMISHYALCNRCGARSALCIDEIEATEAWNRRTPEIVKVETSFYDKEEIHKNCTVQVLTNTATGETSVGWWKNA